MFPFRHAAKTVRNGNLGLSGNLISSRLQRWRSVQTKTFAREIPSATQATNKKASWWRSTYRTLVAWRTVSLPHVMAQSLFHTSQAVYTSHRSIINASVLYQRKKKLRFAVFFSRESYPDFLRDRHTIFLPGGGRMCDEAKECLCVRLSQY